MIVPYRKISSAAKVTGDRKEEERGIAITITVGGVKSLPAISGE
jgi:hypothetical protein